jgi:hypothetical protein
MSLLWLRPLQNTSHCLNIWHTISKKYQKFVTRNWYSDFSFHCTTLQLFNQKSWSSIKNFDYVTLNNKMHIFQMDVLIRFFISSVCFESHRYIIRRFCTCSFCMVCFSCIYINASNQFNKNPHIKMAFLVINTRGSNHVEDWIKHTFENCAFRWSMLL